MARQVSGHDFQSCRQRFEMARALAPEKQKCRLNVLFRNLHDCFLLIPIPKYVFQSCCPPQLSVLLEAASLPVNFLAIVSWFALFSAKTRILKGLAAPRAKETINRENHQDRSHFLHILVRIGGIRTIPSRRPSDTTHAAAGAATRHAAATFNAAIDAARTGPKRAARSSNATAERTNGRASQH